MREEVTMMTAGDRLFTGVIIVQSFADTYNQLSEDIAKKDAIGMNTEALKNGRHNLFMAYAMPERTP
jgi:hypothetical protein